MDYPFSIGDMLSASDMHPTSKAEHTSTSDLVSSSLYMAEGPVPGSVTALSAGGWTDPAFIATTTYSSPHLYFPTPENSPRTYPYYPPIQTSNPGTLAPPLPPVSDFFRGSSLEESPISSPGDSREGEVHTVSSVAGDNSSGLQKLGCKRSPSPLSRYGVVAQSSFESSSGEEEYTCAGQFVPDGVKMPQRKGGMQLWQFLYSILTDHEGKYRNLIEWTHTAKEREFRLLEPDAIAVWWGHHKNKPNMSYDKLSRSLRYYYDKGIIRKISGERFVYRFCIDPEVMYNHMGTSHTRPKLKPMPQDAKLVLSKDRSMSSASPCVAQAPESLSSVDHPPQTLPPPYPLSTTYSLNIPTSSTYVTSDLSIRRCHSFDSASRNATHTADQSSILFPASFPSCNTQFIPSPSSSPTDSSFAEYKPFTANFMSIPAEYTDFPPPTSQSHLPPISQDSSFVSSFY